ncbi:MAG: hypothetical protein NUW01_09780 [Gemmatimonadaceae bacterium]|nr:hypothetical protein [Gemmatimonadaceae bacterium]
MTLIAPTAVTGTWSLIDTSRVLSCAYNLTAVASGGRAEETVVWTGATIWLDAPPALLATQPHPATRVAGWFGAPDLASGSSVTAQLSVGREAPFTAAHQLRYRTTRGAPSRAGATVQCLAP